MVININQAITNLEGKPFEENGKEFNLKDSLVNALFHDDAKEALPGADKMKKYNLAKKIYKAEEEVELSHEEIVKIKEYVGKLYVTAVTGAIYELLD